MTFTPAKKRRIRVGLYGDESIYIGYAGEYPFYTAGPEKYHSYVSGSAPTLKQALNIIKVEGYTWHVAHQELFLKWFKENINQ